MVWCLQYIREQDLFRIVLDDLRRVTHFARQKERLFAEHINQKNSVELRREINTVQKELNTMRRRNMVLTSLFKRLSEQSIRIVYRDIGAMDSAEDELIEEQPVDEQQVVELRAQEETEEKTA